VDEDRPAVAEEALHPPRARGGLGARRQREPHPACCLRAADRAVIEQHPGRAPGDEPVETVTIDEPPERRPPCRPVLRVVEEGDGAVDAVDLTAEQDGGVVVERRRGRHQPDTDPRHEPVDDARDGRRVRPPDVTVAQDAGERRERLHERRHLGPDRGDLADAGDDRVDGVAQVGQEDTFDERRQRRQVLCRPRDLERVARRRLGDGVAVPAGGHEVHHGLGLPRQRPELVERAALAAGLDRVSPRDAQHPETVEEVASREIRLGPQVEVERRLGCLPLEPQPPGLAIEVGLQRRDGRVGRGLAHDPADDQSIAHELERQVRPERDARTDRLRQLGE
jgi:hypothetical protein